MIDLREHVTPPAVEAFRHGAFPLAHADQRGDFFSALERADSRSGHQRLVGAALVERFRTPRPQRERER